LGIYCALCQRHKTIAIQSHVAARVPFRREALYGVICPQPRHAINLLTPEHGHNFRRNNRVSESQKILMGGLEVERE
jgi:hypothetical protein